jgi:hypothetical protein
VSTVTEDQALSAIRQALMDAHDLGSGLHWTGLDGVRPRLHMHPEMRYAVMRIAVQDPAGPYGALSIGGQAGGFDVIDDTSIPADQIVVRVEVVCR